MASSKTKGIALLSLVVLSVIIFKLFFLSKVFPKNILLGTIAILGIVCFTMFLWKRLVPDTKKQEIQFNKALNIWAIFFVGLIGFQILTIFLMFILIVLGII